MRTHPVHEGEFRNGLPFIKIGEGRPLLVLGGLSATHTNPTGFDRRMQLRIDPHR